MIACKYCGKLVQSDKLWKNQPCHTSCVLKQPYDFEYETDKFSIKIHSDLLSSKRLKSLISKLPLSK